MSSSPIAGLDTLFASASAAARSAQHYLDSRSGEGPYAWYAIPQVSVQAQVSLKKTQGGLINVILGKTGTQEFTHQIGFSLVSTPLAPPRLASPSNPDAFSVSLPAFLLRPAERPAIASLVLAALQGQTPSNESFADDPGTTSFQKEINAFVDTLNDPKKDEGVVFLRIGSRPPKYLVIRIGDHGVGGGHDGIYVVEPENDVPVTIYDFLGSRQQFIWYEPFAAMAAMFRQREAGQLRDLPAAMADVPSFDQIAFSAIASGLLASYQQAGSISEAAPALPNAPQVTYSLRDVTATLSYDVPAAKGQDTPYVGNVIAMRVDAKDGAPRMSVQLTGTEFELVGDARQQFLDSLQAKIGGTDPACNNVLNADASYASDYCAALRDEGRQKSAVILLAYRDQPPQPKFLAVWTGVIAGADPEEERDFAFTCTAGENGLQDFQIVFQLEDPEDASITGRQQSFDEARLDRAGYVGFHNFIHAVRIWDLRAGWITPKGAS
jgi:hypothetical protein